MEKEKLFIYDETFFKKVTYQTLQNMEGGRNLILHDIFKDICENKEKYNMGKDQIAKLVKSGILIVESMPTVYKNVAIRDKIICLALMKSNEYDVTVYTKDETLALDLILNGIRTKNVNFSKYFVNIGKSQEKGDIYIYDTCTLLKNMGKIDFSKNIHYFSICVLEELFHHSSDKAPFFKFLYVFNEYSEHVKILNTVSSTQRGGRYSYTDLLILYSSIRSKNEFRDKNITLVTDDRQLYFETIYLNLFDVTDQFDYFNGKSHVEEDDKKDEVFEHEDETAKESKNSDMYKQEEEIQEESYECDESAIASRSELLEDAISGATIDEESELDTSESFLQYGEEEQNTERTMSLEKKVIEVTNNYKELTLKKYHGTNILDEPEIIDHVYDSKFRFIVPLKSRKLDRTFSDQSYKVHPGYWVTFKDSPKTYYKITKIKDSKATLLRL